MLILIIILEPNLFYNFYLKSPSISNIQELLDDNKWIMISSIRSTIKKNLKNVLKFLICNLRLE